MTLCITRQNLILPSTLIASGVGPSALRAMPLVSEIVHPKSLNFQNQRKVVILRDTKQLSWESIAEEVVNLVGAKPSPWLCREVYQSFNSRKRRRPYRYSKCGRKPWKISRENERFLLKRLLALRRTRACTSTTLQRELLLYMCWLFA